MNDSLFGVIFNTHHQLPSPVWLFSWLHLSFADDGPALVQWVDALDVCRSLTHHYEWNQHIFKTSWRMNNAYDGRVETDGYVEIRLKFDLDRRESNWFFPWKMICKYILPKSQGAHACAHGCVCGKELFWQRRAAHKQVVMQNGPGSPFWPFWCDSHQNISDERSSTEMLQKP